MCRLRSTITAVLAPPLLLAALVVPASAPSQAAGTASLAVSAVVLSRSVCKFSAGAMILDFGTIDPSSNTNATGTATRGFKCDGSAPNATFSISAGDGLNSTGPGTRRVRHTTLASEFMAYSVAVSPATATVPKNSAQTLTVTGTIVPADFQNAAAGAYSDTLVITLTP